MKKAYTLIELLAVIVILAIISAIAYPKIISVIGSSKLSAYNTSKNNIIESAKLKYVADVNSAIVTEYSVVDLINEGYINKKAKNPLTNEDYNNKTKVLITNENGNITYDYIEGNTLYDLVKVKDDSDGVYKEENKYIYKGSNAKNYISFNEQIYRIIMIDEYRNVYLLKDKNNQKISKNKVEEYVNCYYNDNYSEIVKSKISNVDILSYEMFEKSYLNNESYINNDEDIWVKNNNDYKVLTYTNNTLNDLENAYIMMILKLNNNVVVSSGEGTQLSPYIINE